MGPWVSGVKRERGTRAVKRECQALAGKRHALRMRLLVCNCSRGRGRSGVGAASQRAMAHWVDARPGKDRGRAVHLKQFSGMAAPP